MFGQVVKIALIALQVFDRLLQTTFIFLDIKFQNQDQIFSAQYKAMSLWVNSYINRDIGLTTLNHVGQYKSGAVNEYQ